MLYSRPPLYFVDRTDQLGFIKEFPFATIIVCQDNSVSHVSKLPLILKEDGNDFILEGHFSRANPLAKKIKENSDIIVMFDGPHGYISPLWYEDPSKSVPTWNYSTVIVEGKASFIESPERILNSVLVMTKKFETSDEWRKQVEEKNLDFLATKIIGIEIAGKKLHSKLKLSQNKSEKEIEYIIDKLSSDNPCLADLMRKYI